MICSAEDVSLKNSAGAVEDCALCHHLEVESFRRTAHAGSGCGVCHGDSAGHLSQEDKKGNIVNPNLLSFQKANRVCLECHEEKGRDVREKFLAVPSIHDDLRCSECHVPHLKGVRAAGEIEDFRGDLSVDCASCHTEQAQTLPFSPHGRADMKCADCHQFHTVMTISRDIEEQIDRCLSCHPAEELEFKRFYAHPLRERQIKCSDCHNPHSGRHEAMLKDTEDDVCGQCHRDIRIEGGRHPLSKNTDHSLRSLECTECHEAHGANFDKVLKYGSNDICTTCHR